ncbi:hypothetical protein [Pseudomonas asiatica]|uniref:hypothetical protein n=1 Tax=Pseudomonas asiatica TaxID=2219225 RepID=UPI0032ED90B2
MEVAPTSCENDHGGEVYKLRLSAALKALSKKTIARLWGETLFDSQPAIYPAERLRLDRDQPN